MVRPEGFEPPTPWFEAKYSIQLSYERALIHYGIRGHFFLLALSRLRARQLN